MKDDGNMFLTLKKERDESVSFGNNHSGKIIGVNVDEHAQIRSI
jgi:hypothetical protein